MPINANNITVNHHKKNSRPITGTCVACVDPIQPPFLEFILSGARLMYHDNCWDQLNDMAQTLIEAHGEKVEVVH